MKNYLYIAILTSIFLSSCGGSNTSTAGQEIDLIPVRNGDEWGYINKKGEYKINAQFDYAGIFNDGIALVKGSGENASYGYIDQEGKFLINPTYKTATDFVDGIAIVVAENEHPKAINKKGEAVFTLTGAEKANEPRNGFISYAIIKDREELWGFADTKGKTIINPQFKMVGDFSNNLCPVQDKSGKWGYVDNQGKIVINPQFQYAASFEDGMAVVNSNGKFGLIDKEGKIIVNPQFQAMLKDGNKYIINSNGKVGWADKEGKFIINPQFDDALGFNGSNLAAVRSGRNWGYVDDEGKFVINPQFSLATPFNGSLAVVGNGSQIGIIDAKGKYSVNPQFDGVTNEYSLALAGRNTKGTVYSDYFDVATVGTKIHTEITENTVSGFSFSTKIADMLAKNNRSQNDFNYYRNSSYLFQDEEVTKGVKLSLAISGTIYISRGWNYVINPDAQVDGFQYRLDLSGKALEKKKEIIASIKNGFSNYNIKQDSENGDDIILESSVQKVIIADRGNAIYIDIDKLSN